MRTIMIVAICFMCILIIFNKKMRFYGVLKEQFKIFKDARTSKTSYYDVSVFYILPLLISIIVVYYFKGAMPDTTLENILSIYSIIFAFLLGTIAMIGTTTDAKDTRQQVSNETFITIMNCIIISFFILIDLVVILSGITCDILYVLLYTFIIMTIEYLFMIFKRIWKISV